MKKQIVLASLLAAGVSSFTAASTTVPSEIMDYAQLGMPFSSASEQIGNFYCVTAPHDNSTGSPVAEFQFVHNMSTEQIKDVLSGGIDSGLDFPLVQLSAGGSIENEFRNSDFSSTWTASATVVPDVVRFNPGSGGYRISDACQNFVDELNAGRISETDFLTYVGDEFISQLNLGASLLVQMELTFGSKSQKEAWDAHAKLATQGSWVASIEGFMEKLSIAERRTISIDIKAYQHGGDSARLAEILPNNILSCSMKDLASCKSAFRDALQYASDFGSQLSDESKYNVLSYTTTSFANAGLYSLVPSGGSSVPSNKFFLRLLEQRYKDAMSDLERANELLGKYSYLVEPEQLSAISEIKQYASHNAYLISKVSEYCFDNPYNDLCENQYNKLTSVSQPLLKEYDGDDLIIPDPNLIDPEQIIATQNSLPDVAFEAQNVIGCEFKNIYTNEVSTAKRHSSGFVLGLESNIDIADVIVDMSSREVVETHIGDLTCYGLDDNSVSSSLSLKINPLPFDLPVKLHSEFVSACNNSLRENTWAVGFLNEIQRYVHYNTRDMEWYFPSCEDVENQLNDRHAPEAYDRGHLELDPIWEIFIVE
ncbi:hypothetical protein [Saccharospirillum salsuginis]|uniref:Uncharacterized protein n=1 Tax=Saccharospirillum salsuginis TaxID=418750 RepID=A0A918K0R3_9GAMM|nr:hypothetical protein [Saccharospirillum salsuginis]GGX39726.1 hypothetical protein GCM10007392_02800 [Saccharospirillum salsuginis]